MVATMDHPAFLDSPDQIASTFRQYWDTTVTANDKDQFVTFRALIDWHYNVDDVSNSLQLSKHRSAIFLIWAYHRLIVLQYRATTINNLRATLILPFSCSKISFLENLIIFFKTQLQTK